MKSTAFGICLLLAGTGGSYASQPAADPAPPPAGYEAAGILPAPSAAVPPAVSVDKDCAEAIGSANDKPPSGTNPKPASAAGGPPVTAEAKKTGCMVELPDADAKKAEPKK